MIDRGLVSITYNRDVQLVVIVYAPDAPYDIKEIQAFVDEMSDARAKRIMIYEAGNLRVDLFCGEDGWSDVVGQVPTDV